MFCSIPNTLDSELSFSKEGMEKSLSKTSGMAPNVLFILLPLCDFTALASSIMEVSI